MFNFAIKLQCMYVSRWWWRADPNFNSAVYVNISACWLMNSELEDKMLKSIYYYWNLVDIRRKEGKDVKKEVGIIGSIDWDWNDKWWEYEREHEIMSERW